MYAPTVKHYCWRLLNQCEGQVADDDTSAPDDEDNKDDVPSNCCAFACTLLAVLIYYNYTCTYK